VGALWRTAVRRPAITDLGRPHLIQRLCRSSAIWARLNRVFFGSCCDRWSISFFSRLIPPSILCLHHLSVCLLVRSILEPAHPLTVRLLVRDLATHFGRNPIPQAACLRWLGGSSDLTCASLESPCYFSYRNADMPMKNFRGQVSSAGLEGRQWLGGSTTAAAMFVLGDFWPTRTRPRSMPPTVLRPSFIIGYLAVPVMTSRAIAVFECRL